MVCFVSHESLVPKIRSDPPWCLEGVGDGFSEDGSNFFDGVTSGLIGGGGASGIAVVGVLADEARDAVCISMIFPRLVFNVEVVFLQAESPAGEPRREAGHCLLHRVEPLQRHVVGDETEASTPEVWAEVLDGCFNDGDPYLARCVHLP